MIKELSPASTGIVIKKTKTSTDNRRGVLHAIVINPQSNSFYLESSIEHLDSEGKPLKDAIFPPKKVHFNDKGEEGEFEYDENHQEIPGSYKITKPENLEVTNWYNQLGSILLGAAIKFIERKEAI